MTVLCCGTQGLPKQALRATMVLAAPPPSALFPHSLHHASLQPQICTVSRPWPACWLHGVWPSFVTALARKPHTCLRLQLSAYLDALRRIHTMCLVRNPGSICPPAPNACLTRADQVACLLKYSSPRYPCMSNPRRDTMHPHPHPHPHSERQIFSDDQTIK